MKKQTLITIIVMAAIFTGIAVLAVLKGHNAKIPENPPETLGNTSGNLNNKGYFCEHGDLIYFANAADNYYLYVLDPSKMTARKITEVPVSYINAAGNYLYFYYDDKGDAKFMGVSGSMKGIYRLKVTGKDSLNCLDRCASGIVSLIGNNVYYQHYSVDEGMTLYSVATNGTDKGQISSQIVNPACVIAERIYFPDMENMFYLNVFDTVSHSSGQHSNMRMYNPTTSGDYIFFMNVDDDYKLYRYGIYDNSLSKITNERVDIFNVYGNAIFYQTNSESRPRLVRVGIDGAMPEIIAEGNFTDINCTSMYTFFRQFDDEETFYMVPTNSGTGISNFNPIIED